MRPRIVNCVAVVLWMIAGASVSSCLAEEGGRDGKAVKRATREPDVVFIPTPDDVVEEMLRLAALDKNDVLYDLGCGDGRIVVAAAKRYGCRAVGVDIDPLRVEEARRKVEENHLGHLVTIRQGDLFDVSLRDATVVTLYLSPKYNARLLGQLNQMKPGSRVVSHLFGIEGARPDKEVQATSKHDRWLHPLLLWKTPIGPQTPR